MENLDKKEEVYTCKNCGHGDCCGSMCGMHGFHGGRYFLVKMILKILVIILIFWCGFKLGEMTGFIRAEYGGGVERGLGGYGSGMMRGGWNDYYNNTPTTIIPATPTPTPAR